MIKKLKKLYGHASKRGNFTPTFKMTIGKKILGSFMIVVLLVTLMSVFTYVKVGQLNEASQETLKKSLAEMQLAEELALDVSNETVAMLRFSFTGDLADAAAFENHRKFAE